MIGRVSRGELCIILLLLALLVLGPAAHSWFEWRVNRDVAATQIAIERRLATVERWVTARGDTAPADVLTWLQTHSVACPILPDCPPCPTPGEAPSSGAPIDNGS